jgi:hypothetical protein
MRGLGIALLACLVPDLVVVDVGGALERVSNELENVVRIARACME